MMRLIRMRLIRMRIIRVMERIMSGQWMKPADAAKALGVSRATVTCRARDGEIKRKKGTRGFLYLVEKKEEVCQEDLLADLAGAEAQIEELEAENARLKNQIAVLESDRERLLPSVSDKEILGLEARLGLYARKCLETRDRPLTEDGLRAVFLSLDRFRTYSSDFKADLASDVDVHIGDNEDIRAGIIKAFRERNALANKFRQEIRDAQEYLSWAFKPFRFDPDREFNLLDELQRLCEHVAEEKKPAPVGLVDVLAYEAEMERSSEYDDGLIDPVCEYLEDPYNVDGLVRLQGAVIKHLRRSS